MQSGFVQGIDAALTFGVDRFKDLLKGLTAEQLAQKAPGLKNTIATLVLHTYATEVTMAYRFRGQAVPDELKKEFPNEHAADGTLVQAQGETVESLLAKIDKARGLLRESYNQLTDADLDKEFTAPNGSKRAFRALLTLLPQHQGQHFGHAQFVKQLIGA